MSTHTADEQARGSKAATSASAAAATPARAARERGAAPVDGRLVDDAGNVRFGIFAHAITEVNHRDYALTDPFGRPARRLARRFGFNQFQFLGALSEQLVFGCAITDIKYVGTAFAYCYEPATRRFAEFSLTQPLARGTRFTQTPESGICSFASGRTRITMSAETRAAASPLGGDRRRQDHDRRRVPRGRAGARADAHLHAGRRDRLGLRAQDRRSPPQRHAHAGRTSPTISAPCRSTATTTGAPATCAATPSGTGAVSPARSPTAASLGMNVSCGVNETSFTENCFWVDGRLHKLDTVAFEYDRNDLMRPWRVSSYDGRLALEFHPEGKHAEHINAYVVATNFNQLFGRYRGSLTTEAGERIAVDGMLGYMESHYAKW